MTKKDCILIAKAVKTASINCTSVTRIIDDIVNELCCALASDNPRFNADRFRVACGVEGDE